MTTYKVRVNHFIRVPQVRLIDENQVQLGVVNTHEALRIAQERGLDLVEVSPLANPPVCKIIDFGAYKYRQEKAERKSKAKQKKIELKGIRLTFKIGTHDFEHRVGLAIKFLEAGDKVRLEMILRGREMQLQTRAREKIKEFISRLGPVKVEQPLSRLGNRLIMIIGK
ncbi:MAG: translation initiation factor IF-3 [Patescibacteria group bacterium]|nr:translation initiation factor IF-3 [Patescibacteria group bacterium]